MKQDLKWTYYSTKCQSLKYLPVRITNKIIHTSQELWQNVFGEYH